MHQGGWCFFSCFNAGKTRTSKIGLQYRGMDEVERMGKLPAGPRGPLPARLAEYRSRRSRDGTFVSIYRSWSCE